MEPDVKKQKTSNSVDDNAATSPQLCQHFVVRKKRLCRITPARGEQYCGEHLPLKTSEIETESSSERGRKRILCPLDPKHTVYERNLHKHLEICNAKAKDLPEYIVPGLNAGPEDCIDERSDFKLADIDEETINIVIDKVNKIYEQYKIGESIEEQILSHDVLNEEVSNEERGQETLKHLVQASSILGHLKQLDLLKEDTSFIEFGAGKGQVAFWVAKAVENLPRSHVLLIDKASLRHKKDNKMKETHSIHRVRADISEFDIRKYDLLKNSKQVVGVSKHLCGAATDFAIRCILNGNENGQRDGKTIGFLIALCCHHRCSWKPFVGKEFFIRHDVSIKEFQMITKMVGWAVCGTGMSRERRKELEDKNKDIFPDDEIPAKINSVRDERKEIGFKCKRLLDMARMEFLEVNGYKCSLKYYVKPNITLENICLVALLTS